MASDAVDAEFDLWLTKRDAAVAARVRSETLEEAARIADSTEDQFTSDYWTAEADGANRVAANIRARAAQIREDNER